jgi:hypothetical protein
MGRTVLLLSFVPCDYLQSDVSVGMNVATVTALSEKEFRDRWIEEFKRQSRFAKKHPPQSVWEGHKAYREFERNGLLEDVMPPSSDYLFSALISRLFTEVALYRAYEKTVVASNRSYRDAIDALRQAEARLRKAQIEDSNVGKALRQRLHQLTTKLEETRVLLERQKKEHWREAFLALPSEQASWSIYMNSPTDIQRTIPDAIVEWAKVFERFKYSRDLVKRIDLDRNFQIRTAVILRIHFFQTLGISLRTISRLVVLTYVCGGIGHFGGGLTVAGRKRQITVSGVEPKLRAAGLR